MHQSARCVLRRPSASFATVTDHGLGGEGSGGSQVGFVDLHHVPCCAEEAQLGMDLVSRALSGMSVR